MKKIIMFGLIFIMSLVYISAYDYNVTPIDNRSVFIEYQNFTRYYMSYDRWCYNNMNHYENYTCEYSNYILERDKQINTQILDFETYIYIPENTTFEGVVKADVFIGQHVDLTPGIENVTRQQVLTNIEKIENNPDGTLNDSTLPKRWQFIYNGKAYRDTSAILSDILGFIYNLIKWTFVVDNNYQTLLDNQIILNQRDQELCDFNPQFSWCT